MAIKTSALSSATNIATTDLIQVVDVNDTTMAPTGTNKKATAQVVGNNLPVVATGSTTSRKLKDRFADTVNVKDFGAAGDGIQDDSAAFQAAINALSSEGGKITVSSGSYKLNTEPTWGTKSLYWDLSTGCVFSGAGTVASKFPYMETNHAQMAVGPWIQSKTTQGGGAAINGGIAAFNAEMLQPSTATQCQSVAGYFGAAGSSPSAGANVWAINALIRADQNAGGVYQCIEVDVDTFSTTAQTKGISISGGGTVNASVGLEVTRLPNCFWNMGIYVTMAQDAIVVNPAPNGRGIVLGSPPPLTSTAFSAKQFGNNADTLLLQRNTDTSSSGYFLRAVNAANTGNIYLMDTIGNFTASGIVQSAHFIAKEAALPTAAGSFVLGATNQPTVGSAGSASALPATPRGYLVAYDGPTKVVIPYYNA